MRRIHMRRKIARRIAHVLITWGLFLLPQAAMGGAEEEELRKLPGYVDFDAWTGFENAESTVEIYIKDPILSLVARLTGEDDPELSDLLSHLKLIRVQTYPLTTADTEKVKAKVEDIRKKLEKDRWEIVVRAREPDEQAHVYLKSSRDKIAGLVIMSVEYGEEIAFVNIVGDIDLNSIARLGDKFDIPGLDSLSTPADSLKGDAR